MKRSTFIRQGSAISIGLLANPKLYAGSGPVQQDFPVVRTALEKRRFSSPAIEDAIKRFDQGVANRELAWLFNNCFPNTLDTTVTYDAKDGKPDTYVITGDIDAMWMRDSTAQVWPYLQFAAQDGQLHKLIAGVIHRQTACILKDPYANAFYFDAAKQGEWKTDHTDMKPGVHERKWEIDSLCYPIRLAYHFWKKTGDQTVFTADHQRALRTIFQVFLDQQRKHADGPYKFQRNTSNATDTLSMGGYGNPVNPVGLICSAFRPSDDATVFSFLIPSNFFAATSLLHAAEITASVYKDDKTAKSMIDLSLEVQKALQKHAVKEHAKFGKVYAFETDGFGNHYLMDDANIPSLLAMPYLGTVKAADPVYLNTRNMVLSQENPFFYSGTAASGIGGPHVGKDMIWPMSIIIRGMTSTDDKEISWCLKTLCSTHANTGYMHESFHKDDPSRFTRSWFAWANTLFGEFCWKVFTERPHLLK